MSNDTLLGRPIRGEISHYTTRDNGPQLGPEEFLAGLDTLFATGQVSAVAWNQYTPYFNDGEACEFHTGEVVAYPTPDLDPNYKPEGEFEWEWEESTYKGMEPISTYSYRGVVEARVTPETVAAVKAFSNFRPFQNVLHSTFGDPAVVIATPDGFDVQFFDHD